MRKCAALLDVQNNDSSKVCYNMSRLHVEFAIHYNLKALSHGAIFLATCNAVLLLNFDGNLYLPILHLPRVALQVA